MAIVEEAFTLQENLQKMYDWSIEWQMLFNIQKCKVMHLGSKNMKYDYFMGEERLESISEEKDLGIYITESLTPSKQVAEAVKRANRILGIIYRTYEDKSKENMLRLYKSLVRPHLDYCIQAWRPYLQQDIDNIERVQRKATRMITELKDID